ncbi:MAG: EAL domain-containing protein [Cyanophyceae cyanobacterium]
MTSYTPPKNALRVYFQPIVHLQSQRVYAHEALARWETSLGTLLAGEVIQVGMELGISQSLNLHLWEYAASHSPGGRTSVNASPRDVVSQLPDLLRCAEDAQSHGDEFIVEVAHPPHRSSEQMQLARAIAKLRRSGVAVWATDHEVGPEIAEHLQDVPVDGIKVDCRAIQKNPVCLGRKVRHIQDLGIRAIAEKIESEHLWRLAKSARCDYGQGLYLGEPQPKEQIVSGASNGLVVPKGKP